MTLTNEGYPDRATVLKFLDGKWLLVRAHWHLPMDLIWRPQAKAPQSKGTPIVTCAEDYGRGSNAIIYTVPTSLACDHGFMFLAKIGVYTSDFCQKRPKFAFTEVAVTLQGSARKVIKTGLLTR